MHATIEVLHKTGVFGMNITLWQSKPVDTWTLIEFKKIFDEANTNRESHTAKQAGYSGAHNVKGVKTSTTDKSPPGAIVTTTTVSDADHANCMMFGKGDLLLLVTRRYNQRGAHQPNLYSSTSGTRPYGDLGRHARRKR
jgi:hypothetical protein